MVLPQRYDPAATTPREPLTWVGVAAVTLDAEAAAEEEDEEEKDERDDQDDPPDREAGLLNWRHTTADVGHARGHARGH